MKVKTFFLSLLLALGCLCANAVEMQIVLHTNGDNVAATLSKINNLTIDGENLVINLKDGTKLSSPIATISKISFDNDGVGVGTVNADDEVAIASDGATITISGLTAEATLTIFDISGKSVLTASVTNGSNISLDNLPSGLYIASLEGKVLKFIRP